MISLEEWLKRGEKKPKKAYIIPKATKKRAAMNREYSVLKAGFLWEHPYCQITIRFHNLDEQEVIRNDGFAIILLPGGAKTTICVPKSNQIHHTKKPKCKYLNDITTWLAASPIGHEWVENNKREARKLGLLENI